MDPATESPEKPVDERHERHERSMGSEYSGARPYLARVAAQKARESDAASHGSNDSDFAGSARLID